MSQTILLTGITGFIAKHVAVRLLNAGYTLRGTLRNADRMDEVRAAILQHLSDPSDLKQRLVFVTLDLGQDAGWAGAMEGVDAVIHMASPFPPVQPKDPEKVIRPAVDGTLRVLKAAHAAGVGRVVLTSSVVAVIGTPLPAGKAAYDEMDWTDVTLPYTTPYEASKTLAEQAAWEFTKTTAPQIRLTTINPGLVTGPPLDRHYGTSIGLIERLKSGKDPMMPRFGLSIVDVRDVAEMHLRALAVEGAGNRRFLASAGSVWSLELADILAKAYPDRKIATRRAPNWLVWILGLFDRQIRSVRGILDKKPEISNTAARDILGMEFISVKESILASAEAVVANE